MPTNFSNKAREATMVAACAAGLDVRGIVNEPTAAAFFYAFEGLISDVSMLSTTWGEISLTFQSLSL